MYIISRPDISLVIMRCKVNLGRLGSLVPRALTFNLDVHAPRTTSRNVEVEQSQRTSTASQPLAAPAEGEQNQGESMVVAPRIAKAVTAETEQSTSSAAQYLATTSG